MTKLLKTYDCFTVIVPEFFTLDELVECFLWKDANIEDFKNIACEISGTRTVFGSWLYTTRGAVSRGGFGNEYHVTADSIDPERIQLIKAALQYLHGLNIEEITKARRVCYLENFIDWLNDTKTKVPTDVNKAKSVYREYTKYLEQIVKTHDSRQSKKKGNFKSFGNYTASQKQAVVLGLLREMFGVENIAIKGMTTTIPQSGNNSGHKDADLDEMAIDKTLSYCFQFFEQVADFCLEAKPYPQKIYLLEHEALLVPELESQNSIITPFTGTVGTSFKGRYWELERGILRSKAEVEVSVKENWTHHSCQLPSYKKQLAKGALAVLERKQATLDTANDEPYHRYRLELGLRAIKAYFLVLLDVTGMNDSTLATVKWEEDKFDEEVPESKNVTLRNIKRRAGNKEVVFNIQSIFMGSFRTFVKLRRFVLNGYDCDTLFFTGTGQNSQLKKTGGKGGYGKICYDALVSLYPILTYTGSRILRQNKKRWLMQKTKGQTFLTAAIMQHKPETGEQYYPHETRAESQDQLGNYLIYQHSIIMEMDDSNQTSAGGCDSPEFMPQADSKEVPIKPDCHKKMTCLYCTFYRIKPIANEIRKVLSMEYVINRHSILHAHSEVHFDVVMGPILERIEMLLQTMVKLYPETEAVIEEMRLDVYENQNLHWYWEARLQLLWELGWV